MIRPGASPLWKQLLTDLLVPPVLAVLWWTLSRGWAASVQGGSVGQRTRRRQAVGFWLVLAVAFAAMISITLYGYFT